MGGTQMNTILRFVGAVALLALVNPSTSLAQGKIRVAIWDFENHAEQRYWFVSDMGPAARNNIDTAFSESDTLSSRFSVIEREKLALVMQEQGLSSSGALDQQTAAKLGQVLGIKYIITGGIDKFAINTTKGGFGGIGGSRELIGRGLDEAAAFATLDEAAGLGIVLLDTAERYASGASEVLIGRWLASQTRSTTETVRIATKVAPSWVDGPGGPFDLSYIDERFCGSLDRLGVDTVEILMTHAPDAETPIEETLEALETIRASGRCVHVGACNLDAGGLSEALDAAQRLSIVGYEVVQNEYNLLTVDDEAATRSICTERGVAFTAYSPLAAGVLTGKYTRDTEPAPNSRLALRPDAAGLLTDSVHDAIDRLRACAANNYAVECGALALAWVARHPDVIAPVVGPSRLSPHLSLAKQALDVELTATHFSEIAQLFSTGPHPD